jgi:hypothetical protein
MPREAYDRFTASEIWCPQCRRAQPVREHLLLVLPTGQKFEFTCAVCGTSLGERMDDDRSAFTVLGPAPGERRRG